MKEGWKMDGIRMEEGWKKDGTRMIEGYMKDGRRRKDCISNQDVMISITTLALVL